MFEFGKHFSQFPHYLEVSMTIKGSYQRLWTHWDATQLRALLRNQASVDQIQNSCGLMNLGDSKTNAHLTKYDTVHGRFKRSTF